MYEIKGILKDGSEIPCYSTFTLGNVVKIVNCGQQYECDLFNDYFHCGNRYLYIKYKANTYEGYWTPALSPKENLWIITGMGLHPNTNEIILCLENKLQKCCVFGINGVELISKGKLSRTPKKIYQIT